MSPDEIGLVKVLLVLLGPFALDIWWITISHFSGRYRAKRLIAVRSEAGEEYSEAELRFLEQVGKARHLRTFGVLLLSLAGSVCGAWLFGNAGDPLFFLGVVAAIFSPAIIMGAWKLAKKSN